MKKILVTCLISIIVIIVSVVVLTSYFKKDYTVVSHNVHWLNRESNLRNFTPISNSLNLFQNELKKFDKTPDKLFDNLYFDKIEISVELTEYGLIIKYIDMHAYKLYAEKEKHILYQIFSQGSSEIKLQASYTEADKYNSQDIAATGISLYQADLLSQLYLAEDILRSYDGDYINIVLDSVSSKADNSYLISNGTIEEVEKTDFDFQTVCFTCAAYRDNVLQGSISLFIRS